MEVGAGQQPPVGHQHRQRDDKYVQHRPSRQRRQHPDGGDEAFGFAPARRPRNQSGGDLDGRKHHRKGQQQSEQQHIAPSPEGENAVQQRVGILEECQTPDRHRRHYQTRNEQRRRQHQQCPGNPVAGCARARAHGNANGANAMGGVAPAHSAAAVGPATCRPTGTSRVPRPSPPSTQAGGPA